MTARTWAELRDEVLQEPDAVREVEAMKQAMRDALTLAEIREQRGLAQTELAQQIGVTQPRVAQIEHTADPYLSTLEGYVEALGGRLALLAVFDDEVIEIRRTR